MNKLMTSKPLMTNQENIYLSQIFEGGTAGDPLDEILYLSQDINADCDLQTLRSLHSDLIAFFTGNHPEYRRSTMPYHNLRHSLMVVLASARLFHGLHCNGVAISAETLLKGLLSAYFHDTGMLLKNNDAARSGTEYIANHEDRSISYMEDYISRKNLDHQIAIDCAVIIRYTELASDPTTFAPHSREIELAGQVVGSADILAQMADRYYLECLPRLFDEQKAGGVNQHETALELMEHTAYFYHNVVLKRLVTTFADTADAMKSHFRNRHTVDRDLYLENIDKNIGYLKTILEKCDSISCIDRHLKRIPPII